MRCRAHAKINWDLRILGQRPDGYHELDTVMVSVGLADRLTIEPDPALVLTCDDPTLSLGEGNLVVKAARALAAAAQVSAQARIRLEKKIPVGGGLGGGSSDAAATLQGLNSLWGLRWPRERLAAVAAALGSDVAFFLWGGWCRCGGRGEEVEPFAERLGLLSLRLFLIVPPFSVATPAVYKALGMLSGPGIHARRALTEVEEDVKRCLTRLHLDGSPLAWPDNALLHAACAAEPRLEELQEALRRLYPGRWQMSGSGAVHVLLARTGDARLEVESRLRKAISYGVRVVETTTINDVDSPTVTA